jgi:hypothetical protein
VSTDAPYRPGNRFLLATCLWLLSLATMAGGNALPAPLSTFHAEYRVTNGSIQLGTTTISLQPDTGGWHYRSITEASGLASLFDWAARAAKVRDADGVRTLDINRDTLDGFSATLAMIQHVARGKQDVRITTIDEEGERETLVFRQGGRESISVPFGTFDAVRVERVRRGKKRETITWLAPELDWVAVRIDQRRNGDLTGRLELIALDGEAAD